MSKLQLATIEKMEVMDLSNDVELLKVELDNTIIPEIVEDIKEFNNNLKLIKETISKKRKEFFANMKESDKLIITLEKEIDSKINEAKQKSLNLQREEIEKNEKERELVLIENLNAQANETVLMHFKNYFENYISQEKTRNILTSTGKLKKPELEKMVAIINNFTIALSTLGKIGMARFESNGFNFIDAQTFEKEQIELFEKQREQEEIARLEENARQMELERLKKETELNVKNEIKEQIEVIKNEKIPEFEITEDVEMPPIVEKSPQIKYKTIQIYVTIEENRVDNMIKFFEEQLSKAQVNYETKILGENNE